MRLPAEFEERMRSLLGEDFEAFFMSMETPPVRALRINRVKSDAKALNIGELSPRPLPFCPVGYIFEAEHIGSHPLHHSGAIYIQEPAAMAAIECVDIEPGMKILDVCASPGGKTTQAAAKLCGEGFIITNEIDTARCRTLAQNVERMGIRNALVTNADSSALGELYHRFFDLVIVDAPCSGEGMMRKNPLAVSEWSMENVLMCAERQKEILNNVADTVKPGGKLLYSTCTFAPEENEEQISLFLAEHSDFKLIPVSERVAEVTSDGLTDKGEEMRLCRRFYPHVSEGEGQFIALLLRDADVEQATLEKKSKKDGEKSGKAQKCNPDELAIKEFLEKVLSEDGIRETEKYTLVCDKNGVFGLGLQIPLPNALRPYCVPIGTVQKGRVIPHHNFFSAYGKFFRLKIELSHDDERISAYLHGESIRCRCENGFAAVIYCGAPLGGAKVTGGEAKNHYPKGLRI